MAIYDSMTPLGTPVVPEVNDRVKISSLEPSLNAHLFLSPASIMAAQLITFIYLAVS